MGGEQHVVHDREGRHRRELLVEVRLEPVAVAAHDLPGVQSAHVARAAQTTLCQRPALWPPLPPLTDQSTNVKIRQHPRDTFNLQHQVPALRLLQIRPRPQSRAWAGIPHSWHH